MIRNPPGDFDPAIPSMLSDTQNRRATASVPWGIDRIRLGASANIFALRATAMRRGQEVPWWFTPLLASDEMTYECDANLGSPATVDCTQIQWHQLGALSNTVQVGPGETRFLSSSEWEMESFAHELMIRWMLQLDTCNLALSATVAVTLTWNQIQTALAALLNLCVSHPLYPSQGGRAFFGHPSPPIGRKKEKRDDITGMFERLSIIEAQEQITKSLRLIFCRFECTPASHQHDGFPAIWTGSDGCPFWGQNVHVGEGVGEIECSVL